MQQQKSKILVIRKSCISGKVIWAQLTASKGAGRVLYYQQARKEIERHDNREKLQESRKQKILQLISDFTSQADSQNLTKAQRMAIQQLQKLSEENVADDDEFYQHIMRERQLREEAKAIRQQMKRRQELKAQQQ